MTLGPHNEAEAQMAARVSNELTRVAHERGVQTSLISVGTIPHDCADPDVDQGYKLAVLAEEFGEVARDVLEGAPVLNLRHELIQVAAVAVAWAEALTKASERRAA